MRTKKPSNRERAAHPLTEPYLAPKELRGLAARMRTEDPMRRVALQMADRQNPDCDPQQIVDAICDSRVGAWRRRIVGMEALRFASLTETQRETVEPVLCRILETHGSGSLLGAAYSFVSLFWDVSRVSILCFGLCRIDYLIGNSRGYSRLFYPEGVPLLQIPMEFVLLSLHACASPLMFIGFTAPIWAIAVRVQRQQLMEVLACRSLGVFGTNRSLVTLGELYSSNPAKYHALSAVTERARRILDSKHSVVSPEALSMLASQLVRPDMRHFNSELSQSTLRLLERFGSSDHIRTVQNAAESHPSPDIQSQAEAVLEVLKERAAREQIATKLLRASSAPDDGLLLRPASGGEIVSELLVRPIVD